MNNKVSVILPTFNRANFIVDAINSFKNQTYKNKELIIVDDGSLDHTKSLVKKLLDKNIFYYFIKNSGQTIARNFGIAKAKGDYICFLDSDDLWYEKKLELQIEYFKENKNIALCYTNLANFDEKLNFKEVSSLQKFGGNIYKKLLKENFIAMSSVMAKVKIIQEFNMLDKKISFAPDYDLWLKISAKYPVGYLDQVLVKYRISNSQISIDKLSRFFSNQNIIKNSLLANKNLLNKKQRQKIWLDFYCKWSYVFFAKKNKKMALKLSLKAIKTNFLSKKPYIAFLRIFLNHKS